MNNIPLSFQSIVRAQDFLQKSINSSSRSNQSCDTIALNPCKPVMSNISTIPTFRGQQGVSPCADDGLSIQQLRETFARAARRAYEEELISERGQETLNKAIQYNISFDKNSIDWLALMDEIEEYETLISKADEINLDWDYRYYDPMGLENAIEACQHQEYLGQRELHNDFYATR